MVLAIGSCRGQAQKFREKRDVVCWQTSAVVDAGDVVRRVGINDWGIMRTLNKPRFVVGATCVISNVVLLFYEIC